MSHTHILDQENKAFICDIMQIYMEMYTWYQCHVGEVMVPYLKCVAKVHNTFLPLSIGVIG